ncbi:unnamed protein product [Sympodiomycopsis kandeliae]
MTLIHIVLLKIKEDIWTKGNGKEELLQKLEALRDIPIVKNNNIEIQWGPPVYTDRSKEWNYGLYSKFASKEQYAEYSKDADHQELVKTLIRPNTDDVLSYDFEF